MPAPPEARRALSGTALESERWRPERGPPVHHNTAAPSRTAWYHLKRQRAAEHCNNGF